MPKMSRRWRNAAIVMAVLGFVAISLRLANPEVVLVQAASNCIPFYLRASGECLDYARVQPNVPVVLIGAALNAVIWFGVVYLIFLLTYGIRKAFGGGSRSTAPVGTTPDATEPETSPEP